MMYPNNLHSFLKRRTISILKEKERKIIFVIKDLKVKI